MFKPHGAGPPTTGPESTAPRCAYFVEKRPGKHCVHEVEGRLPPAYVAVAAVR